ncbi:immunity 49 family protein [Nocardia sp. CA2R105]|uniref:immunity 49 family protein n=1 Tax=Nocardia coffeae TaxID=2873381 RepID=UPI001CA5FB84|nr:immunity 49 family protein [Nocardia coffeae]MBY8855258.1 immunity 49 family protein [Nocardia coffeae]
MSATKTIDGLETTPEMIDVAFSKSMLFMRAQCGVDSRAVLGTTWESVVAAMQVGSAMFAVTSHTEGTVECRIAHEIRQLPAIGSRTFPNVTQWLNAFWLAIVCRDQERMTQLCNFPVDRLREAEGDTDEFVYLWVDTLQAYWLRRPGVAEKLTATIRASYPEVATLMPRDRLGQIVYQPINLFHRFITDDRAEFGDALVEALELHREYWTADEDRAEDPDGCIALGPLAITCLAYDAEFPVEVESAYIPTELVQRGWLGEFPA